MYRNVATILVALAAYDLFFLDGRYTHAIQMMSTSVLHFCFGY